ncbi:leucine-rich repeat domain-containing protein [Paraglaciecola sp.]|uniref:leucine-rich repeat domain-containing protein n=1 Tax=Paraglaciecola sp. TaxID=1920173 RepID=UPI003EF839A5
MSANDKTTIQMVDLNNRGAFGCILKSIYSDDDGLVEKTKLEWKTHLKVDFSRFTSDDPKNLGLTLKELDHNSFKNFGHLTKLTIRATKLKNINVDAFKHLSNLQELTISGCDLDCLEPNVFNGLSSLKSLTLTYTNITNLTAEHFSSLTKLETLNLQHNQLSILNENIFSKLESLTVLRLSHNPINNSLPDRVFVNQRDLRELELNNTYLSSFKPDTFSSLSGLVSLNLSYCKLSMVLESNHFDGLSGLKILNMKANRLEKLNANCFQKLAQLNTLNLSQNCIHHIGANDFSHLQALIELDLSDNQINNVVSISKAAFKDCQTLQKLDISGNKAKKFDRDFLALNDSVEVSWEESSGAQSFYEAQIDRAMQEQNVFTPWSNTAPLHNLFKLIGFNKVYLIGYLKVLPILLFLAVFASIGSSSKDIFNFVLFPFYYSLGSVLLFLVSYRYRLFHLYKLRRLSECDLLKKQFLVECVELACKQFGLTKIPEIAIVTDTKDSKPICDVVGMHKNKFILYLNDALFTDLNRCEINEIINKKVQEACSYTMPLNTIFRAAKFPVPFLFEFRLK